MLKQLNLPPCLEVRKSTGASRFMGLFAKGCIQRGTRLFSREIHTTGIGGYTLNDVRSVCHYCLEGITNAHPIVCRKCRIISYCSNECLEAARPLHLLECDGIAQLEKLRGKITLKIPRPSSWLRRLRALLATAACCFGRAHHQQGHTQGRSGCE